MREHRLDFGPTIGHFMGQPIPETLDSSDGRFIFDRIAEYSPSEEGYPLEQLARGERLFGHGLIYRREPAGD